MYRPAIARSLYRTVGQFQKCSAFARTSSFCNFSIPSHISQCCYSAQATINNKEDAKNPKLQTVNDIFNAIPLKEEINYSIWVLEALSELPKAEQAVAVKDPKFLQIIQFLQANLQEFTPPDVTKCLKYLMILYPEEDPDVVKKMEDHIQQVDSRMSVNQLYEVVMSHKVTQTTNLRKEVFRQAKEKLFLRWTEVNEPNVLIGMLFMADDQALPNLETKALQLIEKMSQQQIFSVLFFLCQRKRRNKPLIRALVFHLNNKGKELTFGPNKLVHLARICDKLNIYDNVLLRRWSLAIYHHLMSETDFPEIAISSLTWSISGLRWHDQTLIDALAKKVLLSDNKQSTDLLTSLFAMCATVNYMPTELRDSLPELCKAFDETFMKEKCRSFLEVVWSLAILQGLRESQLPLQYILDSEFQNKLKASLPDTVYPAACIKLMNINAEVKLNMPDYKGVLLPDDFLQMNSIQVPIKKHRPLVDKAAVALANMFPIEKFLKLDVQSHLGYLIDIEMLVNSVGKPQPVNSSNESLQKLAIKVLDFSDMTINTGEPTGRHHSIMAEITASDRAYCKIILHAAKYPHCSVNGVLLVEKHRNKEAKGLKIVDAIPLFHLTLTLAPMMEIALTQIDGYCKLKGLTIGGYYQANEHYQRVRPNAIACKIADRIHDHHSDACLIMVENESLSMECEREAIKVYTNQDGKWKPKEQRHIVDSECLAKTSSLLQSKAYQELVDFDAHLADISLDWQNTRINDMVDHST